MQYVLRYHIQPGKHVEFVEWMQKNEADFAAHAADGWEYAGTWLTVRGFGRHEAESRWNLDGYGALGAGWGDEVGVKLAQGWFEYADSSRPMEAALFKGVHDVDVLPGT